MPGELGDGPLGLQLGELQAQVRGALFKQFEDPRHHVAGCRVEGRHLKGSRGQAGFAGHGVVGAFHEGENLPGIVGKFQAARGEHHTAAGLLVKLVPHLSLEFGQVV